MFRAERPQAGRKRQFHQWGIEIINEAGSRVDFEAIQTLYRFLVYVGVQNPKLKINDLGCLEPDDNQSLSGALKKYFEGQKEGLCKDCLFRLEKNVMRIFDCKVPGCQPVIQQAPWDKLAPLSEEFEELTKLLEQDGIPFEINRRLVRGLDYYNGAVFEVTAEGLGAQDAVAGGGRYDGLYSQLGARDVVPCTGFSIGVERLLAVLDKGGETLTKKVRSSHVYFAPIEEEDRLNARCVEEALKLGEKGMRAAVQPGVWDLKTHLKRANQMGIRYVVILGPDEMQKGKWTVRDLDERKQEEVDMNQLAGYLEGVIGL